MQESWDGFFSWEDLLEEEMASHSTIPAWRIPWTEEPGGPQSMVARDGHNLVTKLPPLPQGTQEALPEFLVWPFINFN